MAALHYLEVIMSLQAVISNYNNTESIRQKLTSVVTQCGKRLRYKSAQKTIYIRVGS